MNGWTIIMTFTLPHEAHMVKSLLESEEIEVMLKDELMTQVYNFYSNAIGGVKLLVKDEDYKKAHELLINSGYLKEQQEVNNNFLSWFDRLSSKLPLTGKLLLEIRIIIVTFFIIAFIITCILLFDYFLT